MCFACLNCMKRYRPPAAAEPDAEEVSWEALEAPDNAGSDEIIVLPALSRVHIQLGYARVKVASFATHAEAPPDVDVETDSSLEYSGRGTGWPRIRTAKFQRGVFVETAKAAAHTDPGRKAGAGKKIGADAQE